MNSKIKVEYTTMRVNNSGYESRKYNLAANVRLDESSNIERITDGSINLPDGRYIGGFGEGDGTGFTLTINSGLGSEVDRAEVFAEVNDFMAGIREQAEEEKGGEA